MKKKTKKFYTLKERILFTIIVLPLVLFIAFVCFIPLTIIKFIQKKYER